MKEDEVNMEQQRRESQHRLMCACLCLEGGQRGLKAKGREEVRLGWVRTEREGGGGEGRGGWM